jgi:hypothetical protein
VSRAGLALVLCLCLSACAAPQQATSKETLIQAGMVGGLAACHALLDDMTIVAEPDARGWCLRMLNGCRELPKRAESSDEQTQAPR